MNAPSYTFTTPKGRAVWPKLNEPDTRFDQDGVYSVELSLAANEAEDLIKRIDKLFDENLEYQRNERGAKVKPSQHRPYREEEDEEGNPTGSYLFRFKAKARYKNRRTGKEIERRPKLFDATGQPCPNVNVGGGSTIKVNANAAGWYAGGTGAGVTLYLNGVQIIDLKQWSGETAADMGFDKEDGYTADTFVAAEASAEDEDF